MDVFANIQVCVSKNFSSQYIELNFHDYHCIFFHIINYDSHYDQHAGEDPGFALGGGGG